VDVNGGERGKQDIHKKKLFWFVPPWSANCKGTNLGIFIQIHTMMVCQHSTLQHVIATRIATC